MRIAPLAFFCDPSDETARRTIRDVARITHHHEEAYVGALAVVVAIRAVSTGPVNLWPGRHTERAWLVPPAPNGEVAFAIGQLSHRGHSAGRRRYRDAEETTTEHGRMAGSI